MTAPSPAAIEAARKFVEHDDGCELFGESERCDCPGYDERLAKLAAAFDAFAKAALLQDFKERMEAATDKAKVQFVDAMYGWIVKPPTMPLHHEDANEMP